ncbi:hypothetical protein [Microbacterium sediminis]|uniref:Uncharacterized protein n=1 Tax=Microbacterium sediminis TaxID=904291 RepID=A0A1B9NA31_9MICO|nr:hypothetical protein [Microbacterium sediminis]OCG73481.1 hypothetical protein A7J15_07265 [Microbacterium sediminis]QBR73149.1 hypothetical protein E3O41_00980 [Microbacterium sediminis]
MTAAAISDLRSGSWAPGGAESFRLDFTLPGGGGGLASWLLGWALDYIDPLPRWEEELRGNKSAALASSDQWRAVARGVAAVEEDLRATDNSLDVLEGRAARALEKRIAELREQLSLTSDFCAAIAEAMELSASIATMVYDGVFGALTEIAGFVDTLADPFAIASTINPFDGVNPLQELIDHAIGFIEACGALIEAMFSAFENLIQLIQAALPLLHEAIRKIADRAADIMPFTFAAGGLLQYLVGTGLATLLQEDARVTELLPSQLEGDSAAQAKAREAWEDANAVTELHTLGDFVQQNGYTDAMGHTARAVVDIKLVEGADGNQHYVVSLPSTQDWNALKSVFGDAPIDELLADYGAPNDFDSNIALMIMENPVLKTQYERAVLQAMEDAGVPAGADVVWTGFSQGGIMAANLAASSPYNAKAVITNGAPIDGFLLPPDVPVYAFQHATDPVPLLDFGGPAAVIPGMGLLSGLDSHHTITLPDPDEGGLFTAHDNEYYTDSVNTWRAGLTGDDAAAVAELEGLIGGEVVDHQMHTFSESEHVKTETTP